MTRETGRRRYWRQVREIEEELDVPPSRARQMWQQYFGKGGVVRRPVRRLEVAVRAATDHAHCPFCRDDVGIDDVECSRCHVRVHAECLEELDGRCPTLGCRRPGRVRVRTRARLEPEEQEERPLEPGPLTVPGMIVGGLIVILVAAIIGAIIWQAML